MTPRFPTRLNRRFWSLTALVGIGCGAVPADPKPSVEAPTKAETAGLTALHRHAVKLFIDQFGFGIRRIEPPLTDVLEPPKSQAQGSADQRPAGKDPVAIRPDKDGKAAHFSFAKTVGEATAIPSAAAKKTWVVKEVQLVGLVKHKDPVVYLSSEAVDGAMRKDKKEIENKDAKTRQPDTFETKALEVIRGGGELVQAEKQGETIRALSGIYAGKQCAACHERPGEMLGAFSYRLSLEDAPAKAVGANLP
ncbi:hypothetical protein [Limnoglobus roseus]|uniref:Cytochrome c domain-containing protein n=1 Tax=Limnoglobus roseus TaxID=2598579 RepID=A0A5C1AT90_9BACT|nr:hypothetical protein [Limnoglobus roseus]QEL20812.1 hypothetical protein PX52LOC_07931 [Limnoglobus roseus]